MRDYKIIPIDGQTWQIEDCFHDLMYLLEGEESAILIDAGIGIPGLKEVVQTLTHKPVDVIFSHGHLDHIGGIREFETFYMSEADEKVATVHMDASYRLRNLRNFNEEFALDMPDTDLWEIADIGEQFSFMSLHDGDLFNLGGRNVEVIATPGHTPGSLCFLDRERRNLYSADTVCDRGVLLFFDHSLSVAAYLKSIQRLQERSVEFDCMWPGHHDSPLGKEFLIKYAECAKQILDDPTRGIDVASGLGAGKMYIYDGISLAYQNIK